MRKIKQLAARIIETTISTEVSDNELAQQIMDGNLLILKGVFSADESRRLRDLTFDWGPTQIPSAAADFYALKHNNHFSIQRGVSSGQKTLHYYHSYNYY